MDELQAAQLELAKRELAERDASAPPVEKQRIRTSLQGLMFGTSDEAEAFLRSKFSNQTYDDALAEIRGGLKAYKEEYPLESIGYEIAGAAIPALIPGGQGSLLRAGGRAALEGGAYAFGSGEGGFQERASNVPIGLATGAVGGAIGHKAADVIGGLGTKFLNSVRRTVGGRGSSVVENEIQRLVEQTGRTVDEITQDIIDGKLLAENPAIRSAVRGYRSGGGEASTIIQEGLKNRPSSTRKIAMDTMKQSIGVGGDTSEVAARRTSEKLTKQAESAAYSQFDDMLAPNSVMDALEDALLRVPSAADELDIVARAVGVGRNSFYEIAEDGTFKFTRKPTIKEAEIVRRVLKNKTSSLFKDAKGAAGEAVGDVELDLREALDAAVPDLGVVRQQASLIRGERDAYKAGLKALGGDVNEKLADFSELSPELVDAYRSGLMAAMEARAATGSKASLIKNLADPSGETKEAMLLREVFPQDQIDNVLKKLDIASQSQATSAKVLGGSPTTETAEEISRQGLNISAVDATRVLNGDIAAMAQTGRKIVNKMFGRGITDKERARIAKILVSDNPELVKNAIKDESGMQALVDFANKVANTTTKAGRASGGIGATSVTLNIMEDKKPGPLEVNITKSKPTQLKTRNNK